MLGSAVPKDALLPVPTASQPRKGCLLHPVLQHRAKPTHARHIHPSRAAPAEPTLPRSQRVYRYNTPASTGDSGFTEEGINVGS